MLHHPVYAGYYRHGHRALDPRRKVPGRPGTGRTINQPADCLILLEGRCPAYITPERFWANQERLAANRSRMEAAGAVRQGPLSSGRNPPLRPLRATDDGGLQWPSQPPAL